MSTRASEIRERLGHPVIDGDGHVVELTAVFADFARDHGAGKLVDGVPMLRQGDPEWVEPKLTPEERRRIGLLASSWFFPADADYLASVALAPRYYERLQDAGIDFSVLYPTLGLMIGALREDEQRVILSAIFNEWMAEQYKPFGDRITVAAVIPAFNPDEAVAEMVHAKELGAKVALIPSHIRRPLPGAAPEKDPLADLVPASFVAAPWIDAFGLDSKYDYDPMWAKAVELGLPLACHSPGQGLNDRASVSNYVYNHIGHFAASGAAFAKSAFLGGVTQRFPNLRVALLEGGVAVGVEVLLGLAATFEKRSAGLERLNPNNLDRELFLRLVVQSVPELAHYGPEQLINRYPRTARDDFELAGVASVDDICDQFCTSFYWGCEADDPLVGLAFDSKVLPKGAKVRPILGSDIGHWDVTEFDQPLVEAYELLEKGILDHNQLHEFVLTNAVRFLTDANPNFFERTVIEKEVNAVTRLPA